MNDLRPEKNKDAGDDEVVLSSDDFKSGSCTQESLPSWTQSQSTSDADEIPQKKIRGSYLKFKDLKCKKSRLSRLDAIFNLVKNKAEEEEDIDVAYLLGHLLIKNNDQFSEVGEQIVESIDKDETCLDFKVYTFTLPKFIRESTTLESFKTRLKTMSFDQF